MRSRTLCRLALLPIGLLFLILVPALRGEEYLGSYRLLRASAMVIAPQDKNMVSQGTGWLVDREARLLVTCRHVVSDRNAIVAIFPLYDSEGTLTQNDRDYYLKKAPRHYGTVLDADPNCDLAVIELKSLPDDTGELSLASKSARAGDRVHFVGNPGTSSSLWLYSSGNVHDVALTPVKYENGQKVRARICRVDAEEPIEQGMSGGPVVNEEVRLVGVTSGHQRKSKRAIYTIDVSEVRAFLNRTMLKQGTTALAKKDYERAVRCCTLAIKYDPKDALAYNERGAAHSFLDQYAQAVRDYSASLRINPDSARTYRNRGSAYYYQGRYEKAVADCTEAIRIEPRYALAYLSRSKALARLDREDEARADRDRALQLNPSLK